MDTLDGQNDRDVAEFCQVTGAVPRTARSYLEANEGSLEAAIDDFYHPPDSDEEEETAVSEHGPTAAAMQNSRSTTASLPTSNPTPKSSAPKKKFATLSDLQGDGASASHGHGHGDADDEKDTEYYAGGDKSGLAVADPGSGHRSQIKRLLETAKKTGEARPREEAGQSRFTGQGQTLGGEGEESRIIADPNARSAGRNRSMVERTLRIWADGFSVDDGPLYRYDDPANARTLDMINNGHAPLDIMNVESGAAVDVKVSMNRNENYVQPKKSYTPFTGGGQRLGSPGPSTSSASTETASAAPAATTPTAPAVNVDDTQPAISLQIRLADGTRLPSRFNSTHTIGDVYDFVNRASPGSNTRPYTLATTFPTKELSDQNVSLGDMPEFKRGGVIVQKWS